jgi:alkanesulfonate monooxygenase SsuD/methylene tetrahydromethanopterin reductase-like flavin-dependent oxidoreductase (luciferase family)
VSAARAGHLGLPMMLGYIGGTLAHARRAGDAAGHDPETLQVGISTHFYAAASEQDATEVFEHYRTYYTPTPTTAAASSSTGRCSTRLAAATAR